MATSYGRGTIRVSFLYLIAQGILCFVAFAPLPLSVKADGTINGNNLGSFVLAGWNGASSSKYFQLPSTFAASLRALDNGIDDSVWVTKQGGDGRETYTFTELVSDKFCDISSVTVKLKYFAHQATAYLFPCDNAQVGGSEYCYLKNASKIEWELASFKLQRFDEIQINMMTIGGGYVMFDYITIEHDGNEATDGKCEDPTTTLEPTTDRTTSEATTEGSTETTETHGTEGTNGPTFDPLPSTTPTTTTTTTTRRTTTTTTHDPTVSTETEGVENPSSDNPTQSTTEITTEATTEITTEATTTTEAATGPTTEAPTDSTTDLSTEPPTGSSTDSSTEVSGPTTPISSSTTDETTKTTSEATVTTEITTSSGGEPSTTNELPPITGTSTRSTSTTVSSSTRRSTIVPLPPPGPENDDDGLTTKEILLYIVLPVSVSVRMVAFLGSVFYFGFRGHYSGGIRSTGKESHFSRGGLNRSLHNANDLAAPPTQERTVAVAAHPTQSSVLPTPTALANSSYQGQVMPSYHTDYFNRHSPQIGSASPSVYSRADSRLGLIQEEPRMGSERGPIYTGEYAQSEQPGNSYLPRMKRKFV